MVFLTKIADKTITDQLKKKEETSGKNTRRKLFKTNMNK